MSGMIAGLCMLFAYQDGVRGGRLVAAAMVSAACAAMGILLITSAGGEPIFGTRPKYVAGLAVTVGGSIGSAYALGPGSTSLGGTIAIWVLGQVAVVALEDLSRQAWCW